MKIRNILMAALFCLSAWTQVQAVEIEYQVHQKRSGWMDWVSDGSTAGDPGKRRLEAIKVKLVGAPAGMKVCYRVHMKNKGWGPATCDGEVAGTTGERRRIEAIQVWFENPTTLLTTACYRVYMKNRGWGQIACDGELAGTTGERRRIEAVEISLKTNLFATEIQADLFQRTNVGAELTMERHPVYWTDASFGCSNGGIYARPVTAGWRFVFSDGVNEYNYHTWDYDDDGVDDGYRYCADPYTPEKGWYDRVI